VNRAVDCSTIHEMPEITENFRLFQAHAQKSREKVAGLGLALGIRIAGRSPNAI
jgi:hypothetical protein